MSKSPEFTTSPAYRPDIDGLRAIAVIFVVAYHGFPDVVRAGFIGVDIFFVISGYLISSIILSQLANNEFNFLEFYSRRIKRIFPALAITLGLSFLVGWFFLLADEYEKLGYHMTAGAAFVANLVFWQESGYFDNASETKLLLHLWSLGVEEQFYILWPVILWLAYRSKILPAHMIPVMAIISFYLNVSSFRHDAVAAYFSPQTRFWELLIGAFLAANRMQRNENKVVSNIQSVLGVSLLALSLLLITKATPFPGYLALLPTIGTALLISAGAGAWFNRTILSQPVLVWFGLFSYPLYLWHWPVLTFARIIEGKLPALEIRLLGIAGSIVLAWLTYRYIERPFRFGDNLKYKTCILVIAMLGIGVTGFVAYKAGGFPHRAVAVNFQEVFDYKSHWNGWGSCGLAQIPDTSEGGCRMLNPERPISILVIGDSHAGHLAAGLRKMFLSRNANAAVILHAGCYPFQSFEQQNKKYFVCANELIDRALSVAEQSPEIHTVILAGYAALQIQKNRYHEPNQLTALQISENARAFELGFEKTLNRLQLAGKKIIFIGEIPELVVDPKTCVRRHVGGTVLDQQCPLSIDKKEVLARNQIFRQIVARISTKYPQVIFVDPMQSFCDEEKCYGIAGNTLLYQSRDHLSPRGSEFFIDAVGGELEQGLR